MCADMSRLSSSRSCRPCLADEPPQLFGATDKIVALVAIAGSTILSNFRVGAQLTGSDYKSVLDLGGNNTFRRVAVFDPIVNGAQLAEGIAAGTGTAVRHPGDDEKARRLFRLRSRRRYQRLVVVNEFKRIVVVVPANIEQEFATSLKVGPQVRIDCHERADDFLGCLHITAPVHFAGIPIGILECHVTIQIDGVVERLSIREKEKLLLGTACRPGKDDFLRFGIHGAGIDLPHHIHLRCRQTVWRVAALALQNDWVEEAAVRLVDHAICLPQLRCAGFQDGGMDDLVLALRDQSIRILAQQPARPQLRRIEFGDGIGRRTGDDAIVVCRVSLGLDQPFQPAQRTAEEVSPRRSTTVIRLNQRLRIHGHFMRGAVSVVNHFLRMSEGESSAVAVRIRLVVTGIVAGGGIAVHDTIQHAAIAQPATPAKVSDSGEFAVPARLGQPDLGPDTGIRRGFEYRADSAESRVRLGLIAARRTHAIRLGPFFVRQLVRPCRDRNGGRNRRVGQSRTGQACARNHRRGTGSRRASGVCHAQHGQNNTVAHGISWSTFQVSAHLLSRQALPCEPPPPSRPASPDGR